MRSSLPLVLLAAMVLAACQVAGAPVAGPQADAETRLKRTAVALRGTVMAPVGLIGNDAGSLIGNDAGSLVGPDGASLVGPDGASLVGPDGASLAATRPGSYALRQVAEAPLAGATVFLAHADGTPVAPPVASKTDARGRFAFPLAPAGRYVVVALATTAAQKPARLLALATAITEETAIDVSTATTLVTTAALDRREGPIVGYDTGTYGRAVALAVGALAQTAPPDLANRRAVAEAAARLSLAKPELAPLIVKLRNEVVGAPRPRSTRAPATAEPLPATPVDLGPGSPLINVAQPVAAPSVGPGALEPPPSPATEPPTEPPVAAAPTTPPPAPTPPPPPDFVAGADVDTIAGDQAGFAKGDDGRFNQPGGLGVGIAGTVYVGDTGNHTVRTLDSFFGLWVTADPWGGGPGTAGFSAAPGKDARFNGPRGIAVVLGAGRYVADTGNHVVRYLPLSGAVSAFAGVPGSAGQADGARTQATFQAPADVWWSATFGLYVADTGNHRIRRVGDDQVATVAGATAGFADGAAAQARFDGPSSLAVTDDGAVYVADTNNHRIRRIKDGQVSTFAGDGTPGFADGPGPAARFHTPMGLALTQDGELVVADRGNLRIRLIGPDGRVRTLAGAGGPVANDGAGNAAGFAAPVDVAVHPYTGSVYVADGHRIRRIKY